MSVEDELALVLELIAKDGRGGEAVSDAIYEFLETCIEIVEDQPLQVLADYELERSKQKIEEAMKKWLPLKEAKP